MPIALIYLHPPYKTNEWKITCVTCTKSQSKDDVIIKELFETNLRQRGIGNLNPIKFARCIVELERLYGITHGGNRKSSSDNPNLKTGKELAEDIGIEQKQAINYKKLLTLIPELQELIETGKMPPTVGYNVWAKLPKEEQTRLIEEAVKAWMISTQANRRNLTPEQTVYYRGLQYELEKGLHGGDRGNQYTVANRQNDGLAENKNTAERLAEQYKVAPRTIERDAKVAKVIDKIGETSPVAKQKILAGEVDINKKELAIEEVEVWDKLMN